MPGIGIGGGRSRPVDPTDRYPRQRLRRDFTRSVAGVTCARASTAWAQRRDGSWVEFAANVPRRTDQGLWRESAATTAVVTPSFAGAQAGGALPAGMSLTGTSNGVTTTIVGTGTEDGLPYVDIRMQGTASANTFPGFTLCTYNVAAQALSGEAWVCSAFLKAIGGTFPGSGECYWSVGGVNNINVSTETFPNLRVFPSTSVNLGDARHHRPVTLVNASTRGINFRFFVLVYSGTTIDYTWRVAAPQVEKGAYPSTPIIAGGTRAADVLTMALPALGRALRITAEFDFLRRTTTLAALPILQIDRAASAGDDCHLIARAINGAIAATTTTGGVQQNSQAIAVGASARAQALTYETAISAFALAVERDQPVSAVGSGVPPMRCDRLIIGADHTLASGSDLILRSVTIAAPRRTREQLVATNCACYSSVATGVVAGQRVREWRARHRVGRVPALRLAVHIGGFYVSADAGVVGQELPIGNDVRHEIAIEILGAPTPMVMVGDRVVANGSARTLIGSVTPGQFGLTEFAEGMTFHVHGRETIAAGQARGGCYSGSHAHASAVAHDGSQNLLMTPGAKVASGGATQLTTSLPLPLYITGEMSEPEIAAVIVGNSIDHGSSDAAGDGEGGGGWWLRAIWDAAGGPIPFVQHARGSTSLYQASQFNERRQLGWPFANTLFCGDPTNDMAAITGDQALAAQTFWARLLFQARQIGLKHVIARNTIPRTTSTDAWATVANQTPIAGFETGGTERDVMNTWIAANAGELGVRAVIDVNAAVRDGTALDKWAVGGTADGTHPSPAGCALMKVPATAEINKLRPMA